MESVSAEPSQVVLGDGSGRNLGPGKTEILTGSIGMIKPTTVWENHEGATTISWGMPDINLIGRTIRLEYMGNVIANVTSIIIFKIKFVSVSTKFAHIPVQTCINNMTTSVDKGGWIIVEFYDGGIYKITGKTQTDSSLGYFEDSIKFFKLEADY